MLSGSVGNFDCALKAHVPLSILIKDPVFRLQYALVLNWFDTLRKGVVDGSGAVGKKVSSVVLLFAGPYWMS